MCGCLCLMGCVCEYDGMYLIVYDSRLCLLVCLYS